MSIKLIAIRWYFLYFMICFYWRSWAIQTLKLIRLIYIFDSSGFQVGTSVECWIHRLCSLIRRCIVEDVESASRYDNTTLDMTTWKSPTWNSSVITTTLHNINFTSFIPNLELSGRKNFIDVSTLLECFVHEMTVKMNLIDPMLLNCVMSFHALTCKV